MGTLSHQEARRTYDRIGSRQDSQRFYEDQATSRVLQHGDFTSAESVFEFGCGTGRFALRLFEEYLSDTTYYRGVDVSPRMVRLAQTRLAPHSSRAEVILTNLRSMNLPSPMIDSYQTMFSIFCPTRISGPCFEKPIECFARTVCFACQEFPAGPVLSRGSWRAW